MTHALRRRPRRQYDGVQAAAHGSIPGGDADQFVAQDSGLIVVPLVEAIHFDISFVYSRFKPLGESATQLMQVLYRQAVKPGRLIPGCELPNVDR